MGTRHFFPPQAFVMQEALEQALSLTPPQAFVLQEAHAAGITAVSYSPDPSIDRFATSAADRTVRVFNSGDLAVAPKVVQPKTSEEAACVVLTEELMFSGWKDGVLRCHVASPQELQAQQLWSIHVREPPLRRRKRPKALRV